MHRSKLIAFLSFGLLAGGAGTALADESLREDHLDARGDRIDERLDNRGDRINHRLDRRGDRATRRRG